MRTVASSWLTKDIYQVHPHYFVFRVSDHWLITWWKLPYKRNIWEKRFQKLGLSLKPKYWREYHGEEYAHTFLTIIRSAGSFVYIKEWSLFYFNLFLHCDSWQEKLFVLKGRAPSCEFFAHLSHTFGNLKFSLHYLILFSIVTFFENKT